MVRNPWIAPNDPREKYRKYPHFFSEQSLIGLNSHSFLLQYSSMTAIKEIQMLVHPDFDIFENPTKLYPYQKDLRDSWENEAWKLKDRKDTALLYVSALPEETLRLGLRHPSRIDHPVEQANIERILRWREIIERRMIVLPDVQPTQSILYEKMLDQDIQIDFSNVKVKAYGEFADLCVNAYKNDLIDALQIPFEQASIIGRLSLTSGQSIRNRMRSLMDD